MARVSDKQRKRLHEVLDELLDAAQFGTSVGVVFIQEELIAGKGDAAGRHLLMRGLLDEKALRLRELLDQLRTQENSDDAG